jgi:hypothetical protein
VCSEKKTNKVKEAWKIVEVEKTHAMQSKDALKGKWKRR